MQASSRRVRIANDNAGPAKDRLKKAAFVVFLLGLAAAIVWMKLN